VGLVSEDTERPETQSRRPLKMQPHHRLLHRLMSSNSPDDPVPEPHRDVSTGVLVGSSLSLEDERNSSHFLRIRQILICQVSSWYAVGSIVDRVGRNGSVARG